jgi:succinylglutamate desuccinylase
MLHQIDHLPSKLLDCHSRALAAFLPGPTLMHLRGRRAQPLFISILLHGNEYTGLLALQQLLQKYKDLELPRNVSVFIGNVSAARQGLRHLDDQPDYNRVWPGAEEHLLLSPEARMMQEVVDIVSKRALFASVDIHNNTGFNPHYACVNVLDHQFLQLATLFGRTVVYFLRPRGVQSMALAKLCPAVTLECGKPGEPNGVDHVADYLDACLHLSEIPQHHVAEHDINLFHTVAQVKINAGISFSFREQYADVVFNDDIDRLNFRELPEGTTLGVVRNVDRKLFSARDEQGVDVTDRYLSSSINHRLVLNRPVMPSMLTLDERVIHQDCLCYFMERLTLETVPSQ